MNINELKAQAYDLILLREQKQKEIQGITAAINQLVAQIEEAEQVKKEP